MPAETGPGAGRAATGPGAASGRLAATARITAVALAVFFAVRWLGDAGGSISHTDFRAPGGPAPEFCDPGEPKFISAAQVRGAVDIEWAAVPDLEAGRDSVLELRVRTASGRPIRPQDLLVKHTRLMHVLAVDPGATSYQHLHPEPVAEEPGLWRVRWTPEVRGPHRLFVEFTPKATGRGLFGLVELHARGERAAPPPVEEPLVLTAAGGISFDLRTEPQRLFAKRPVTLSLRLSGEDRALALRPVMGAWMHLVAFDVEAAGFVHLHPLGADPLATEAVETQEQPTELEFRFEAPKPGLYRFWAQVELADGSPVFAPLALRFE